MADSATEVRNAVIAQMRLSHPDVCRHWFDDIAAVDFEGGVLRLLVNEPVRLKYLQRSCLGFFNEAAQVATGRLVAVLFIGEEEARAAAASGGRRGRRSQRTIAATHASSSAEEGARATSNHRAASGDSYSSSVDMFLCPDFTFGTFVPGPGNRLALAGALAVSEKPGEAYNPLFLHGGVGLGKTHLLHAICQSIMRAFPSRRIYYTSCENFTTLFTDAIRHGEMNDFRHRFRDIDVLMIDDIHFLSRRDQTQEEFFHTFNVLHQAQKQVVLSSDASPGDIPDLEDRLVSRFNSGLVAGIDRPCFDTRVAILKMKADLRNMPLGDDVAAYIASRIDSNIRELEGAVTKLRIMASVHQCEVSLELAKDALGAVGLDAAHQPTVQNIIEVVCDYYDVKLTDILSKRKYKSIAEPRQVCMWLARRLTRYSLEEIGGYFGGRDHTTVLHAVKTIERKRSAEERLGKDVTHLEGRLVQPVG